MLTSAWFFSLFLAWATVWTIVLWEYGRVTYTGWKAGSGSLASLGGAILSFLRWYLDRIGGDIICLFRRCPEEPPMFPLNGFERGHYLRLFIGMSAFHSGLYGLVTAFADRSEWPFWVRVLGLFALTVSTAAGQGHLLIAWSHNQVRWRLFVLFSFIWLPIGCMIWLYMKIHYPQVLDVLG